jgi:hypothetical protein
MVGRESPQSVKDIACDERDIDMSSFPDGRRPTFVAVAGTAPSSVFSRTGHRFAPKIQEAVIA